MSEYGRVDEESQPKIFGEAPAEFRELATELMVEIFGRETLHEEAISELLSWGDGPVRRDTVEWWADGRDDNRPLLECDWWLFMSIVERMSTTLSEFQKSMEEGTPDEWKSSLDRMRLDGLQKARNKEAEFERRFNDLCESFWFGYELMDGELVRDGLQDAAALRRNARRRALDPEVKAVVDSTWHALNAMAEPDLQAAFVGAGTLFNHLWEEFAHRLDSDDIADERKQTAREMRALLADGRHRTSFPYQRELDEGWVALWVENAFIMVDHVHRLPEGRAHAEFRESIRTNTHHRRRRIR